MNVSSNVICPLGTPGENGYHISHSSGQKDERHNSSKGSYEKGAVPLMNRLNKVPIVKLQKGLVQYFKKGNSLLNAIENYRGIRKSFGQNHSRNTGP